MRLTELEYQNLIARGNLPHVEQSLPLRPVFSEKAFMAAIVRLAREHGWYAFHPTIAKKSVPGYPDLTLCHPTRHVALWVECKVEGAQPTLQQVHWLKALSEVRETAAFLWTPDDWETIRMRLA